LGFELLNSYDLIRQNDEPSLNKELNLGGSRPFRVTFRTDADEVTMIGWNGAKDEQAMAPGGIVGFSLIFWQIMCPP